MKRFLIIFLSIIYVFPCLGIVACNDKGAKPHTNKSVMEVSDTQSHAFSDQEMSKDEEYSNNSFESNQELSESEEYSQISVQSTQELSDTEEQAQSSEQSNQTTIEEKSYTQGLSYTFMEENECQIAGIGDAVSSDIIIPDTYNGYTVTEIADNAFKNSNITSIVIPNTVVRIGEYAFAECGNLVSVYVSENVTSMGKNAFNKCTSLINVYYRGDTESWCNIAFSGFESNPIRYAQFFYINDQLITELVIPDTVTTIKDYVFYHYLLLTGIVISNSVSSIGFEAFYGCYGLVEVYNNSNLNITKGSRANGLVGYYAKAIYTSEYTSKVSYDGDYIIYTDGDLKSLIGYTGTQTNLVLPDYITEINQGAFDNCSSLTSVTMPDSVTSIGDSAFHNCSSLTSIFISDSVTSIGEYAFQGCSSLTSVTLENTSDWKVSPRSSFSSYTSLSSSELANSSTAATFLKETYYNYFWKRG